MDQPAHLATWQTERREQKRDAIRQAIRRLDTRGVAINFAVVADEAGVDRSWLYSQTDLAVEIRCLRDQTSGPLVPRPQAERASDESLRARLAAAHQALSQARAENRELRSDIRELREELARSHGERWEQSSREAGTARAPREDPDRVGLFERPDRPPCQGNQDSGSMQQADGVVRA